MQSEGNEDPGASFTKLVCILTELEISDGIVTPIDSTRPLDGRQTGDWNDFSASRGYHPDSGLNIVIDTVAG